MQLRPTYSIPKAPLLTLLLASPLVALPSCGTDEAVEASPFEENRDSGRVMSNEPAMADDDMMEPTASAGSPGIDEEPRQGAGEVQLGTACRSDDDCQDGLSCMLSDDDLLLGGGPANGYCTTECEDSSACAPFDSQGVCLLVSDTQGYCFQGCSIGEVLGQEKCHLRSDVSCESLDVGVAVCRPTCGSDEDCGDGFCDFGSGVCVAEPPEGLPLGSECDPASEENGCASGACFPLAEGHAVCSGQCTIGAPGCGTTEFVAQNPGDSMCLNSVSGSSVGDTGFCNQRCDCDSDCLHPNAKCWALLGDIESGVESLGAAGICVDPGFEEVLDDPAEIVGIDACPARPGTAGDAGPLRDAGGESADAGQLTTSPEAGAANDGGSGSDSGKADATAASGGDGG